MRTYHVCGTVLKVKYGQGRLVQGFARDHHERRVFAAALDAIESVILAHACEGVDVESSDYEGGIQTALDAVINHLG